MPSSSGNPFPPAIVGKTAEYDDARIDGYASVLLTARSVVADNPTRTRTTDLGFPRQRFSAPPGAGGDFVDPATPDGLGAWGAFIGVICARAVIDFIFSN